MITIPTLQQLCTDVIAEIEGQYGIEISDTGKSALRATGNTLGAKLKLLYLALGNAQKNMLPDLADSVSVGGTLERWGFIKLNRYPFKATNGEYTLAVTGSAGAIIPSQTTFLSDDDSLNPGQLFILDNEYTLVSTIDFITVRSLTPGTDGSLIVGNTLTATSPIALVDSAAVVTAETIQPLDAESLETYRQEVISSFNLEPEGGAPTDYRLWSQDVQGVAAVYPYTASGYTNRVNLFIESSISDSIDGKGTPSGSMIAAVEEVINFDPDTTIPLLQRGRKPITVIVNYLPVTIITVDIVIPSFIGITVDKQALILSAMTSYFASLRPFVAAADIIENKNDTTDGNNISAVILAAVPGSSFAAPVLKISGVPVSSYIFVDGNIPFLNSVTYS